ncbi:hypothetical protein EIN_083020 [Entamoeba invadens IP1]|uniref:hypothetical protein n=1 Tax=Entamoeba invadens IP1 TaxID=370355 RepID=UPI0002C3E12C|nr:hypothetical protein EIN_083020 [Entamoeba invadens IP1]ELP85190.1 hypothetical protein EIN_083020 [Entamoeba invadens IP1]|eukprot:XP_004184536.1 hypothetical protein EIN_083020 [Entamoeba invadens IP1]
MGDDNVGIYSFLNTHQYRLPQSCVLQIDALLIKHHGVVFFSRKGKTRELKIHLLVTKFYLLEITTIRQAQSFSFKVLSPTPITHPVLDNGNFAKKREAVWRKGNLVDTIDSIIEVLSNNPEQYTERRKQLDEIGENYLNGKIDTTTFQVRIKEVYGGWTFLQQEFEYDFEKKMQVEWEKRRKILEKTFDTLKKRGKVSQKSCDHFLGIIQNYQVEV